MRSAFSGKASASTYLPAVTQQSYAAPRLEKPGLALAAALPDTPTFWQVGALPGGMLAISIYEEGAVFVARLVVYSRIDLVQDSPYPLPPRPSDRGRLADVQLRATEYGGGRALELAALELATGIYSAHLRVYPRLLRLAPGFP